jgi:hypothetical protein
VKPTKHHSTSDWTSLKRFIFHLLVSFCDLYFNLEKSLGSHKSTQHLDAPDKIKITLITNQVTTVILISPSTSICYASFTRPSDFSRFNPASLINKPLYAS